MLQVGLWATSSIFASHNKNSGSPLQGFKLENEISKFHVEKLTLV
jgi:hypothetical protein